MHPQINFLLFLLFEAVSAEIYVTLFGEKALLLSAEISGGTDSPRLRCLMGWDYSTKLRQEGFFFFFFSPLLLINSLFSWDKVWLDDLITYANVMTNEAVPLKQGIYVEA